MKAWRLIATRDEPKFTLTGRVCQQIRETQIRETDQRDTTIKTRRSRLVSLSRLVGGLATLGIYAKRLERGRFASLWRPEGTDPITLTVSELDLFLDGSAMVGRVALTPPALTDFSLASDRAR